MTSEREGCPSEETCQGPGPRWWLWEGRDPARRCSGWTGEQEADRNGWAGMVMPPCGTLVEHRPEGSRSGGHLGYADGARRRCPQPLPASLISQWGKQRPLWVRELSAPVSVEALTVPLRASA